MKTMLQRMCWNSRGWRMPTGNSSDGGYPSDTGYGHEEWNFQLEDSFKGNVYGYTYYTPPASTIDGAKGHFKIGFWSRHPDTGLKLLAGIYHDATLVTKDEASALYGHFESEGIFERRAEELANAANHLSISDARTEVKDSVKKLWLHWKCPKDQIEILSQAIQLPDSIMGKKVGSYFTNPTFIDSDFLHNARAGSRQEPIPPSPGKKTRQTQLAEDAYYRESARNLRVIVPRHNRLSNQFCKWLRENGGNSIVQEQNQVDVFFKTSRGSCLAELKVCYGVGTTKAIREALGQLFEYNFYAWRTPAKRWLIVLDDEPSKADRAYVQRIASEFSLPLLMGWRSKEEFTFDNREAAL